MNTGLLIFIGGVITKAIVSIIVDFQKKDLFFILSSIVLSLYMFFKFLGEEFSIQSATLFSLIIFITFISFSFKQKILPKITEGTLLLYGLISFYLLETHIESNHIIYLGIKWLLVIYCLSILILCITRIRVKPLFQIILFIFFFLLNVGIISFFIDYGSLSLFCNNCSTSNITNIGIFFTGYIFFSLISNLVFIIYFIPIPARNESFKQRILAIKKHAIDLERKYIDIDIGFNRTIVLLTISLLLYLNYKYTLLNEITIISLILVLGEILTSNTTNTASDLK